MSSTTGGEAGDRIGHRSLVLVAQFRIDGQRQDFPGGCLRAGKLALAVAEIGKDGLEMKRQGIIDFRGYPTATQERPQRVAPGAADHELTVRMFATRWLAR